MTTFPTISRSCPYKNRLAELLDGDFCTMCSKTVTDLSAMSEREALAFRAASAGRDVCIRYKAPAKRAVLGAALAATLTVAPLAAAAEEPTPPVRDPAPSEMPAYEPDGDDIVGVMTRTDDVSCDPRRLPEPIELSECRSAPLEYDGRRNNDRD